MNTHRVAASLCSRLQAEVAIARRHRVGRADDPISTAGPRRPIPRGASASRHPGQAARIGRTTLHRLTNLIAHLRCLQESTAAEDRGHRLNHALDPVVGALASTHRKLAAEATGVASPASRPFEPQPAATPRPTETPTPVARFAARLTDECRVCGRSAVTFFLKARSCGAHAVAHLAYALVRELEKLFWILRLYAERPRAWPAALLR